MKTTLKLRTLLLMLIAMLSLVAVACDDDEEGGTDMTTGDTSTGDTAGDTTETDTTETDTTGDDTDTVEPAGACTNSPDIDIIQAANPDPADAAASCGQNCLADPDPRACTITCMQGTTGLEALENDCAGCYADSVVCTINNCLNDCIADSNSQACIDCREAQGCTPEFYTCSGLPRD